jgi:hypothetical protein
MAREDTATAIEQLYALPLGEFTRARNALAARLRKAGQAAEATRVAGLAKPSAVVWTINQLARQDRVGVERLVQAVERLRAAQLQLATGQLAAAQAAERTALDQLRARARSLLEEAGLAGTDEMLERVAGTLVGAASDPATRGDLRGGRLARELGRPGFEVFAGERPAAPARGRPGQPGRAKTTALDDARRLRAARETLRTAETEARERARRAEELERTAAEQRRAAEEAARAAEAARRQAATAKEQVAEAERALRGAEERRPR